MEKKMARILFTVCGVGMGHAGRSLTIIKHLKKKHKVMVLSYADGEKFLKSSFIPVGKLEGLEFFFEKEKFRLGKTIIKNLPKLPNAFFKNLVTLTKIIEKFRPQVIISDYDVNGIFAAKLFGIPSITISNVHIMQFFSHEFNLREKLNFYLFDKNGMNLFNPTDYLLITYLLKPQKKFENIEFFHPIVREVFLKIKPKRGDYFLVYSTPPQLKAILHILKKIPNEKFVVRGTAGKQQKNIMFKPKISAKEFVKELKNCKGIICHGGNTTISEAVVLKKPVYVFSDLTFFERFFNGKMIQKLGFGMVEEKPSLEGLKKFVQNNQKYRKHLKEKNIKPANKEFLRAIDTHMVELCARPQKDLPRRIDEVKKLLMLGQKKIFKKMSEEIGLKKILKDGFKKIFTTN
ncbi:MAG: hypothetical protein HYW50_03880 [Candidatus Diapherotrites archaeon]|nr:hypothetical protein [Candidatus Diapherotrites archaeon]